MAKYVAIDDTWITNDLLVRAGKTFQPMNEAEKKGVEFSLKMKSIKEIEDIVPEVVPEEEPEPIEETKEESSQIDPPEDIDDLTQVNGIGAKTSEGLKEIGIDTEDKLKQAIINEDEQVLELISKKLELIKEYLAI